MKTITEIQAEYISAKRKLLEKKMAEISKTVITNTINNPTDSRRNNKKTFGIELSISSAMGGIGITVYDNHDRVDGADCYGVYWPIERNYFFDQVRLDNSVNEKLKELNAIHDIAKKYLKLNKY